MTGETRLSRLLLPLVLSLGAGVVTAGDEDCERHYQPHAAAGQWHGSFWVDYQPTFLEAPVPMQAHDRWESSLEFKVIRSSEGGTITNGEDDVIRGTAEGEMKLLVDVNVRSESVSQSVQSAGSVEFDIVGREEDFQFKTLELKRPPGHMPVSSTQTITGPSTRVTTTTTIKENGERTTQVHGVVNGKVFDRTMTSKAAPASGGSAPDDKRNKIVWFTLKTEHLDCATMMGKIDSNAFEARLQASGMPGHVIDSNWAASFDERDVDFEHEVAELTNRRIPNPLNPAVLYQVVDRFSELRGNPSSASDYRLCVLAPLMDRIIKMGMILMRQELQRANSLEAGQLTEVFAAQVAAEQGLKVLQLMAVGNCALAQDIVKQIQKKARDCVKWIVAHNPSKQDLLAINRQWQLGMLVMGDAEGLFMDAWNRSGLGAAVQAGPNKP